MNVYVLNGALNNPAFEGLAYLGNSKLLETWPKDWSLKHQTWTPKSLKGTWPTPEVSGNVRQFNDYPCINLSFPAFSGRAVDLLHDLLAPNGELLPVRHKDGTLYYFYNCTTMSNCVDLSQSSVIRYDDGSVMTDMKRLAFFENGLRDLAIFRIRTELVPLFCTQTFVDRVEKSALNGFVFVPIWPLPPGTTYFDEHLRVGKISDRWKPKELPAVPVQGNTVVLRLYTQRKKAASRELAEAEAVMEQLESVLYRPEQTREEYLGNVEGHDVLEYEIRIFVSTPDCELLLDALLPTLRLLKWNGKFHVIKRRGEFMDGSAEEEYVPVAAGDANRT
jgi:hypothetical protein